MSLTFGFCSLSLPLATSRESIKKQEMKNPHQEQDSEKIKNKNQETHPKIQRENPVVAAAWSLRHLGSIAAASFAVPASLVWFFCLRGLGFVLCGFLFGFQGFWVRGLGFVLSVWVSRFLGVWVLFFVISGFQGKRLWVWLRWYTSSLFSFFFFFLGFVFATLLGAWCLLVFGWWENVGKQRDFLGLFISFGFVNIFWVSAFWVC